MLPKRVRVSSLSADIMKILKARTGLTPNIVCRAALILSLDAGPARGKKKVDQLGSELNATTLFGEFGSLFEALILQTHGNLNPKEMMEVITSHIEDGLVHLRKSRSLLELVEHCGLQTPDV